MSNHKTWRSGVGFAGTRAVSFAYLAGDHILNVVPLSVLVFDFVVVRGGLFCEIAAGGPAHLCGAGHRASRLARLAGSASCADARDGARAATCGVAIGCAAHAASSTFSL